MVRIFYIALLLLYLPLFSNEYVDLSEQELTEKINELDWKEAGDYKLPLSNSTLSLPANYHLVIGKDARTLDTINGNSVDDSIEAISINDLGEGMVIFMSINEGYVSLDDWNTINPKAMLSEISEDTEKENKNRRKYGMNEIHVIGWLQEPFLDKENNYVKWSIEASVEGEENLVNSVALKLGRHGYEKLIWVTDKSKYVQLEGPLNLMLNAHAFDQGFRYMDFVQGDKVARYGIASLIAAAVGVKILKATGLIFILKKFSALIIAFFAAMFYKFKKFLKKKESENTDNNNPQTSE